MRNGSRRLRWTMMVGTLLSASITPIGPGSANAQPGGPGGQHVCTPADLQYYGGVVAHGTFPDGSSFSVCGNEIPPTRLSPGRRTHMWADVARSATSVLVNLTMVDGFDSGYVSANACSAMNAGEQTSSSGNHGAGAAIAALAVVPLDPDGGFCVYNQLPVNVLADVQGYFAPASTGGQGLTSITQIRAADTRLAGGSRPAGGSITRVATGAPSGTGAVVANLTMTNAAAPGYITAGGCSTLSAGDQSSSSGNFVPGVDASILAFVPVDGNGEFCIFASAPVDLVVDVQGTFSSAGALNFQLSTPTRRLDTRVAPHAQPTAGTVTRVDTGAPLGTAAVLANLTMTNASAAGFITADKCSAFTGASPTKSSGNFTGSVNVANLALVPVGADGAFCIYSSAPVDLVVDLQGSFSASSSQRFFPLATDRVADTRPTAGYLAAPCDADEMTAVAVASEGRSQTDNIEVILQNHGDASCLLTGSPKLASINDNGTTSPISSTYDIVPPTVHGALPVIGRDGSIEFTIGSSRACNGGIVTLVPRLLVTLPSATSLTVDATTARPGGLNIACGIVVTSFGALTPS